MVYAVLLQNGGHVGFRNIIAERAITEEHMSIRTWRKLPMPFDDTLAYFLDLILVDGLIKTGKQHAIAYTMKPSFPADFSVFDWNSKVYASLETAARKEYLVLFGLLSRCS